MTHFKSTESTRRGYIVTGNTEASALAPFLVRTSDTGCIVLLQCGLASRRKQARVTPCREPRVRVGKLCRWSRGECLSVLAEEMRRQGLGARWGMIAWYSRIAGYVVIPDGGVTVCIVTTGLRRGVETSGRAAEWPASSLAILFPMLPLMLCTTCTVLYISYKASYCVRVNETRPTLAIVLPQTDRENPARRLIPENSPVRKGQGIALQRLHEFRSVSIMVHVLLCDSPCIHTRTFLVWIPMRQPVWAARYGYSAIISCDKTR